MARTSQFPKEQTFNFRVDPALKAAFIAASETADKPAAQILRDFMRAYVRRGERLAFAAEASRQSLAIAARAREPGSDEAAVMREIADELEDGAFADAWE
jgi:predicted DNA-binding protein